MNIKPLLAIDINKQPKAINNQPKLAVNDSIYINQHAINSSEQENQRNSTETSSNFGIATIGLAVAVVVSIGLCLIFIILF